MRAAVDMHRCHGNGANTAGLQPSLLQSLILNVYLTFCIFLRGAAFGFFPLAVANVIAELGLRAPRTLRERCLHRWQNGSQTEVKPDPGLRLELQPEPGLHRGHTRARAG